MNWWYTDFPNASSEPVLHRYAKKPMMPPCAVAMQAKIKTPPIRMPRHPLLGETCTESLYVPLSG